MKLGISLFLCISGLSAFAQDPGQPPFIYFNRLSMAKEASNGQIVKLSVSGYTVMSQDCTRSIQILTFPKFTDFYLRTNNGMIPDVLITKSQTQFGFYDVYSYHANPLYLSTAAITGTWINSSNNGVAWSACKVLTFESHNIGPFGPENMTGTLSLDIADTFSSGISTISNGTNSLTVDSTAAFLYTNLISRSYFQIPDPFQ